MKRHCLLFAILVACLLTGQAQEMRDTVAFHVMSYNVENLFDCQDDSLKKDEEFLPNATRRWNYFKYKKKLDNIARVIVAVGGWTPPALVALCEVENDTVLTDLTRYSALRESGYRYLITSSPDERGINVALLYQRGMFKPLFQQNLYVEKAHKNNRPTRNILHVGGLLLNRDTLDVLVAHFPSRSGGAKLSAPYRKKAAERLKRTTDSLFQIRRHPQIIIMGDFNDYPHSPSVRVTLQAEAPPAQPEKQRLYHLLARKASAQKHRGTYKYQGAWQWLDHIIVSGTLLQPDAPLQTSERQANVFTAPFLLTDDIKFGGMQPFRTYYGMKYQGGFSDHLPVYTEFRLIY